jgi:hypothetical protein
MKNRERGERLAREAAGGPMVGPTPELPDDTPIERVLFSCRSTRLSQAQRQRMQPFSDIRIGIGAKTARLKDQNANSPTHFF